MLLRITRAMVAVACLAVAVGGMLVLDPAAPVVRAQENGAVSATREGLREYKRGNYENAIRKFDEALAADPTDEVAKAIRDEIGWELAQEFIRANFADAGLSGRFSRFGKWVVAGRAKNPAIGRNNNPDEIREFVDAYMADRDVARKLLRAESIRDSFGDFAVPYIQERYMHSGSADARYEARVLLAALGPQAVNALIQVMRSGNVHDRQTASLALGDIRDGRALPVLARHAQDPNEDEVVRKACNNAIGWIRGAAEASSQVNAAKDLYFLQAEGYYRNNAAGRFARNRLVGAGYPGALPVAMYGHDRSYTVWKWVSEGGNGRLAPQEVPLWAYAGILAEDAALDALELGLAAEGEGAWTLGAEALLACVHFHMYAEGMGRYYNGSSDERETITALLGERGFVPHMHGFGLGAVSGAPVLYAALERSLADGYPAVSAAICDALAAVGDGSAVGTAAGASLMRALNDSDRVVRYAAARALVRLGANKDFENRAMVEQVVARNLQETQARAVLVIMEDENLRNRYLSVIEGLGHSASGARTLEEGADLALQGPPWDAILLEGNLAVAPIYVFELPAMSGAAARPERQEPIFHLLSKDVRTSDVPLLIACEESELDSRRGDLADLGLEDLRYLSYTAEYAVDSATLRDTLELLWSRNVEDAKSRTNRMVIAMANELARLDPHTTRFHVGNLLAAAAGGLRLDGRSSPARAALCDAVGSLVRNRERVNSEWARSNVVPNLLATISSDDLVDRPYVKAAAARALGSCYGAHSGPFDEDGFQALLAMLRLEVNLGEISDDERRDDTLLEVADARNAAGEALGRAPTNAGQRLAVKRAQAVNPNLPHPESRTAN
jgi:HEAT repeat protein